LVERAVPGLRQILGVQAARLRAVPARTKGKDERGVGYVKRNAIAGHSFASWAALEARLVWWMRETADVSIHGTTGEPPLHRFRREEASALRPLDGRPPFRQVRDLTRRVQSDCCIEVDTNAYSVPWRLKLTAIRDQLDSLLDEAARPELTPREAVAFLCEREIARKDERRVEMASKIAHFPTVLDLGSFDFSAQPSIDPGQIHDLAACRWIAHGDALLLLARQASARPIWPLP
jgi:hypothetical protein